MTWAAVRSQVEQVADLVAGECYQRNSLWRGVFGTFGRGDDGEEGAGRHRQDGPALPAGPAADLVLIEPCEGLAGLERLLDRPATRTSSRSGTGRGDQQR